MSKVIYRINNALFKGFVYEQFVKMIQENGFVDFKFGDYYAKVYNPKLAAVLSAENLPVIEWASKEERTINTLEYVRSFVEGFKEGAAYFEKTFPVSGLYGNHAGEFVNNLLMNYFHIEHTPLNEGWESQKNMAPINISHELMKDLGYYSGIISSADNFIETHYQIFLKYDKGIGKTNHQEVFHRVRALAHQYKMDVGKAKNLTRAEQRELGGKNYELAFDSINPRSRAFKQKTAKELEKAIELLNDCPEAQAKAKIDLEKIYKENIKS